jgi:uncharacterized protein YndB with AHSA1/START domain
MQKEPFVIERTLPAPVPRVWAAITDREQMKHWYFDLAEFKPETGFEFTFNAEKKGHIYVHLCKITEVIPGKKLSFSWRYEGFPGNSFVTFELFPEGDKTRLRLTHEGLETFGDNPVFARENFAAGWGHIIGQSLPAYLAKTE